MDIRELSPAEALRTLREDPHAVYLDVRTEEEFEAGHPVGARNVPIVFFDATSGRPTPNPDFLAVVQRNLPPGTKLVVGCQAGGRSMRACEVLAQAGYTDVTNVRGGFGGARDRAGRLVEPGWSDAGLPVESGAPPGARYADLVAAPPPRG